MVLIADIITAKLNQTRPSLCNGRIIVSHAIFLFVVTSFVYTVFFEILAVEQRCKNVFMFLIFFIKARF